MKHQTSNLILQNGDLIRVCNRSSSNYLHHCITECRYYRAGNTASSTLILQNINISGLTLQNMDIAEVELPNRER